MTAQTILDFWFDDAHRPFWFAKSAEFDQAVRRRFADVWAQAARGELWAWRSDARGRLAEIIVLDQFSRNLHRSSAEAFTQDPAALVLAQELLNHPGFQDLDDTERQFALLPLMHSESRSIHAEAVPLFERFTTAEVLDFERKHKAIIDRFGRYPHRNAVLGRQSTAEEEAFLQEPGSSF